MAWTDAARRAALEARRRRMEDPNRAYAMVGRVGRHFPTGPAGYGFNIGGVNVFLRPSGTNVQLSALTRISASGNVRRTLRLLKRMAGRNNVSLSLRAEAFDPRAEYGGLGKVLGNERLVRFYQSQGFRGAAKRMVYRITKGR